MTKRKTIRILTALGIPIALGALCLLVINVYVQSAPVQGRISAGLRDALGIEVNINRISFTPWSGLRLGGVRVPGEEGRPDIFSAPRFTAKIKLFSVFGSNLVIEEVRVDSPRITLSPGMALPVPVAPAIASTTPEEVPTTPDTTPSPAGPVEADPAQIAPSKKQRTTTIQTAVVRDGELAFVNEDNETTALLRGIEIDSDLSSQPDATGKIQVGIVALDDALEITEVGSPFQYENNVFRLPQIVARFAGGNVEGTFVWKERALENPAELFVKFFDAELKEVAEGAGLAADRFKGVLSGSFLLRGDPADSDTIHGAGKIVLDGGELVQIEILQTIGDALNIEEISHLKLSKAEADWKLREQGLRIERLELVATNLKLEARGWVREDGKLDLKARLFLNKKVQQKLRGLSMDNLVDVDEEFRALDFDITGTVDDPKTNLLDRVLGNKLKEVNRVFKNFFGGGDKEPESP